MFMQLFGYGQTIKHWSFWKTKFDNAISKSDNQKRVIREKKSSADSWGYYKLSYFINGYVVMYKCSNDDTYLQQAIAIIEEVIDDSDYSYNFQNSQFKDNYKGWVDRSSNEIKNHGKEFPLYESYCWRYVTDLLAYIYENKINTKNDYYQEKYDKILKFTEKNIFDKWMIRGKGNIYRSNTHMFSHWASISLDLWRITKKNKYKKVFEDFNTKMLKKMVVISDDNDEPILMPFKSFWNENRTKIQDNNHANALVNVILKMYDSNICYTEDHIRGLIRMLDRDIWKSEKKFAKFINGKGKGNGFFSDGWMKLGRYNLNLQKRLEKHNRARTIQFYANMCYNAKYYCSL